MILAGLAALGHGQLLAQTTSISRRKMEKKRTHKQDKDSKPSPMYKTTKAPPLDYDSNPQSHTLIITRKHINK
jgi:hypothetical protein